MQVNKVVLELIKGGVGLLIPRMLVIGVAAVLQSISTLNCCFSCAFSAVSVTQDTH